MTGGGDPAGWRFGDCEIDAATFELRRDGAVVSLEPQVFDVLHHLLVHRDRLVTKAELLDEVWGDRFVSESALTSRIKAARRAVGDDGTTQRVIKTLHGRGYRFVAPVTEVASGSGAAEGTTADVAPPPTADPGSRPGAPDARRPPGLRTRYTRSGGFDIAYQVIGEGPDLVFVPGFISNVDLYWELPGMAAFFHRLASFGRLICFDKRGTGVSSRVPTDRPASLEERMDDVRAVLDAAGSERASLFGISEGGPMTLLFAATYPERVDRLILANSYAARPFDDPARFVEDTRRLWGRGLVFGALAPTWARNPVAREELARFERQSSTPDGAAALIEMNAELDATGTLSSITAPTLVLHRRDDGMIPFDRGQELAAGIAGAELVTLPGTDHLVFVEPDVALDHVERFVTGADPVRPSRPERVLASLLFIDVVGSTERAAEVGDERWSAELGEFWACVETEVRRVGGRRVSTTGDGVLAAFDGPARAVRCGLDLVGELARRDLTVRCGVHTSEVEVVGADLAGLGVHVGARVESLASPGEVLVTRTVRDLVAGSGLRFEPRGSHELRGVPDTWELYAALG